MNDKMKQFELDVYETIDKLTNGNIHPYSARIAINESAKRAFYTPAVSKCEGNSGEAMLPFAFLEWYSGMEKAKIERAYQRYLREVKRQ